METKNKTFRELYREAVVAPTPREAFLQRMTDATGCSEHTILSWARGLRTPSASAAKLLEQELGIDRHILFPKPQPKGKPKT